MSNLCVLARISIAIGCVTASTQVLADYFVTGPTKAEVCASLGTVCRMEAVDAVADPKGNLFELPESYPRVDGYSGSTCFLGAKPKTPGILGKAIQAFNGATYMQRSNGKFVPLDAERIVFPCRKS